jgi:hypothetical protein
MPCTAAVMTGGGKSRGLVRCGGRWLGAGPAEGRKGGFVVGGGQRRPPRAGEVAGSERRRPRVRFARTGSRTTPASGGSAMVAMAIAVGSGRRPRSGGRIRPTRGPAREVGKPDEAGAGTIGDIKGRGEVSAIADALGLTGYGRRGPAARGNSAAAFLKHSRFAVEGIRRDRRGARRGLRGPPLLVIRQGVPRSVGGRPRPRGISILQNSFDRLFNYLMDHMLLGLF